MAKGDKVKCLYCEEIFNANKEPSVHIGNRYAHKSCFENKQDKNLDKVPIKNIRKCVYCGKDFDITKGYRMPRQNRYAHIECYEKNYTSDEEFIKKIYEYLKSIGIAYCYQDCERQRNYFISKLGYTNEGIYNALKYFYGVKKGSPEKSGNRIGIVSYIYNEAKDYYNNMKEKQRKMKQLVEEQLKAEEIIIKVKAKPEPQKKFINLDDIKEDEDE